VREAHAVLVHRDAPRVHLTHPACMCKQGDSKRE
jgi:hypothetical protein